MVHLHPLFHVLEGGARRLGSRLSQSPKLLVFFICRPLQRNLSTRMWSPHPRPGQICQAAAAIAVAVRLGGSVSSAFPLPVVAFALLQRSINLARTRLTIRCSPSSKSLATSSFKTRGSRNERSNLAPLRRRKTRLSVHAASVRSYVSKDSKASVHSASRAASKCSRK